MNERIKELIAECEEYRPGFDGQADWYTVFNKQKFAELIVQECIDIIDPKTGTKWIKDQTQEEFWKNQSVHLIKQHFGVEE